MYNNNMNNYITRFKNWLLLTFRKSQIWFNDNKKLFLIWFYVIMGTIFAISFSLWIMAGVGFSVDVKNEPGEHPSFNGVWFIEPYISNNDKELMGQKIYSWENLKYLWGEKDGFSNWIQSANQAYTLYLIFNATLPIWIIALCIVVVFVGALALGKYVITPWVKKNLEKVKNSDNISNENQIVNQ